jgi:putative restriction endonuclease
LTKSDAILKRFAELNVWRRRDERAPHKPLLVLYALAKLQGGSNRLLPFDEIEEPLTRLLRDFGPPRKSIHPELPFYHLQTDGVWEIDDHVGLTPRKGSKNPLRSELRKYRICGGFPPDLFDGLRSRPEVVRELAHEILTSHFPDSLHESIARAVGLDLEGTARSAKRDSAFRGEVVSIWGHQCAFCGFSIKLDSADLAIEAAHIRWVQFGGPDAINNGLACCSIHHEAFDRGAISLSEELRILVSSRLYGAGGLESMFLALNGSPLRLPSRRDAVPKKDFVSWHRKEVFRGEARD